MTAAMFQSANSRVFLLTPEENQRSDGVLRFNPLTVASSYSPAAISRRPRRSVCFNPLTVASSYSLAERRGVSCIELSFNPLTVASSYSRPEPGGAR